MFAGLTEASIGIPSIQLVLQDSNGKEIVSTEEKAAFRVGERNVFAATPLWLITYTAYDRERNQQRMEPLFGKADKNGEALKERPDAVHPKLFAVPSLAAIRANSLLAGFSNEITFDLSKDERSRVKKAQASIISAAE